MMKNVFFSALAFFGLAAISFLSSCEADPCKEVVCAYSGICEGTDGHCKCQVGYEGEHCETITRDKFIGVFNVVEDGSLAGYTEYALNIIPGNRIDQVLIENFNNYFNTPIEAYVNKDTLTIPFQTVEGFNIEGHAVIIDRNGIGQHYYQHAVMDVYYKTTNTSNSEVDHYGTDGITLPSEWTKE